MLVSHVVHDHHPKIFSVFLVFFFVEGNNKNKQTPKRRNNKRARDESEKEKTAELQK